MTTIFETLEDELKTKITQFETFFTADVWPYIKEFLAIIMSQSGKAAISAGILAIPEALTGNIAAAAEAIGAAVVSTIADNAAADAQAVVQQAQAGTSAS